MCVPIGDLKRGFVLSASYCVKAGLHSGEMIGRHNPASIFAAALPAAVMDSGRNWPYFFLVNSAFLWVSISAIMSRVKWPLLARVTAK